MALMFFSLSTNVLYVSTKFDALLTKLYQIVNLSELRRKMCALSELDMNLDWEEEKPSRVSKFLSCIVITWSEWRRSDKGRNFVEKAAWMWTSKLLSLASSLSRLSEWTLRGTDIDFPRTVIAITSLLFVFIRSIFRVFCTRRPFFVQTRSGKKLPFLYLKKEAEGQENWKVLFEKLFCTQFEGKFQVPLCWHFS